MPDRRTHALRVLAIGAALIVPLTAAVPFTGAVVLTTGCATVDLGDNIVPPDLQLDEDFFYCEIQPNVIQPSSCANGGAGEMGSCHTARSSLRLMDTTGIAPPTCEDDRVTGDVPDAYRLNFQAVQFTVQSDPLSSPFYRRPTGLDSHPRQIFAEDSMEADLIRDWITRGGL